jgi:predicted kinase
MTGLTVRIVIGTAGSGKSTIAQRLAREYGAAYLDKDAMSTRFVEAALLAAGYDPGDRESNAYYREQILPLEYDSLLDVAGANLRIGRPVVIDAPFSPYLSDPTFITAAAERFHWPPVDVEVVRVRVCPATLQHRLRERGLERDAYKLAHWDEYWARHGGQACAWTGVRLSELSNDSDDAEFPLDRRSTQAQCEAQDDAPRREPRGTLLATDREPGPSPRNDTGR